MVLAPQEGGFPESGKVAVLRNKGWNIFYALGAEDRDDIGNTYSLSLPLKHDLSSILWNFLKDPFQVNSLLSKAGRSIPYLLENLRSSPSKWFTSLKEYLEASPELLCCAALMGRWNNDTWSDGTYRYHDHKIFQKLTGKSWEESETIFFQLSQINRLDAPFLKISSEIWRKETWFIRSPLAFINSVKGSFSESLLNKFEALCEEILITEAHLYSAEVKEGILKTLEIFGRADLGYNFKRRAGKIAQNFLGILDPSHGFYMRFSEVSPEIFLENIEKHFKNKNPSLRSRLDLVRSLRQIAWEEQYFFRATELLRQYVFLKGEEGDYKPMIRHVQQDALIALFKFDFPQTDAPFEKRRELLKIWAKKYPDFVKEFLLKLICHIGAPINFFPKSPYLEEKENHPTVAEVQKQYFWASEFIFAHIEDGTEEEQEKDWCALIQKWSLLRRGWHPQEVPALEKFAEKRGSKAVLLRKEIERIKARFSRPFNTDFLEKTYTNTT